MKRYFSAFIFLLFFLLMIMIGGQNKAEGDTKYKIKKGDNLYRIAKKYDLSVQDIKKANNIKGDNLSIGKTLLIPSKTKKNTKSIVHKSKKTRARTMNKRVEKEDEAALEEETEEETDPSQMASTERPVVIDKDLTSIIREEKGKRLFVNLARTLSGVPYRLGGSSMKGIDCSALVKKIYSVFGYELPRTANLQFKVGNPVKIEELKAGDLVFFSYHGGGTRTNGATHVGIFLGNDEILHTSLRNREVKVDKFSSPYFLKNFIGAKRLQEEDFNLKG